MIFLDKDVKFYNLLFMSQFLRNYIGKRYGNLYIVDMKMHKNPIAKTWDAIQGTSKNLK